jgi:phage tail sheath protein FI
MSYQSPGVYVREESSGVKPIAGVGTATGAFVGIAEKGPMGEAKLITSFSEFERTFGSFIPNGYLAYAVYQFFIEGGTTCYVVRTCHYTTINDPATKTSASSTVTLKDAVPADSLVVLASSDGTWGDSIKVTIKEITGSTTNFDLLVKYKDKEVESYLNLDMTSVEDTVNTNSNYITVTKKKSTIPVKGDFSLAGGNDGITATVAGKIVSSLIDADFEGNGTALNGLHAFDVIDNINIVAAPDGAAIANARDVISKGVNYCQERNDCFFVADPIMGLTTTQVVNFKNGAGSYSGNPFISSFGALYYPWVLIKDPLTGNNKTIPPSGAVAGTYAHVDTVRGVHKAPAGTPDGYLDSVSGVERILTKGEHDQLDPEGINAIRYFPSTGICVWGAKTLSTKADPEWKYINIRRLFLYLEKSLYEASQWVVFEPNDPKLWGSVIRNITAFLLRVWRSGALFGSTPDEAFFVKVDAENNPPEVRDAGELHIDVGVAPVKPAEFVIISIRQKTLIK